MSNEELAQQIQAGRKELMPELWDAVKGFVAQQAYKAACLEDNINEKTGIDTYNDFVNTGTSALELICIRCKELRQRRVHCYG